jgi:hypothetical protein
LKTEGIRWNLSEIEGIWRKLDENSSDEFEGNSGKINVKIAENGWKLIEFAGNGRNL